MKKISTLRNMVMLMLALFLVIGNVFATKGWKRVTHNTTLAAGDTIIIAAANYDFAISTTQNNNNRAQAAITKMGDEAIFVGTVQAFVLQNGDNTGTFHIYDFDANGGYLYAPGSGNYLKTASTLPTNGSADWEISIFGNDSITIIAHNTAAQGGNQTRMRYNTNNNLFSCYGPTSNVREPVTIYRYEEIEAALIEMPTFSLASGTYFESQQISIDCATEGANILYTTDGSDPVQNGITYEGPITISTTTTLKAVAFINTDYSYVNTATYTFPVEVANIAAFKAASSSTNSTPYKITGDVTFVFKGGSNQYYTYVQDATGGLLVFENSNSAVITNTYTEGDIISGGIIGTYTKYNNQVELVPLANPDSSSSNIGTIEPTVVTIADILANYNDYDAKLVTIEEVTFADGFTGSSTTFSQGENSLTLYNRFSIDTTLDEGTVTDVTGFVAKYNNSIQIYPRYNSDLSYEEPIPTAATPVITPVSGTYADSVVVSISCETEGAEIRYTLDGEEPTDASLLYEVPFTLTTDATIMAKAFMNSEEWYDSEIAEAEYTIAHEAILSVNPEELDFSSTILSNTFTISSAFLTEDIILTVDDEHFALSHDTIPADAGNTTVTVTFDGTEPADGLISITSGEMEAFVTLAATAQVPAPVFTPANGTIDTLIEVAMTCALENAVIYYTTDGSEPTTESDIYVEPIVLNTIGTYTFNAIAMAEGWESSEMATATYTVPEPIVPSIDTILYSTGFEAFESFEADNVYNNVNPVFTGPEEQQWATVYGTPSETSPICGEQSLQMRWYTNAPEMLGYTTTNFDIRNVTYVTFSAKNTSNLNVIVSYSIDGGNTFVGDSLITLTSNARNYRYNVSESGEFNFVRLKFAISLPSTAPTSTSRLYIDSVVVFGVPGIVADVVEAPVIAPHSGLFFDNVEVSMTCATEDAEIRYTLDGSTPDESSTIYTEPFTISGTTTVKAKAWKEGMTASNVTTTTYNFPVSVANIAEFKAANTTTSTTVYKITGDVTFVYENGSNLYIQDETGGLLIYDNQNVITSSYEEGDVISGSVVGTCTYYNGLRELVPSRNLAESTENTGTVAPMAATIENIINEYDQYESRLVRLESVNFVDGGEFATGTASNMDIDQDGETMICRSNFKTLNMTIDAGAEANVVGFVSIYSNNSGTDFQVFPRTNADIELIQSEQVVTPTFSPAPGTYENQVEVAISCATEDASIYYTLDGSEPSNSSTLYTTPIVLTNNTTVKAIAYKDGMQNSEIASASYQITTGINNLESATLIYPNPAHQSLNIITPAIINHVEIYTMAGQKVAEQGCNGTQANLNVSSLASGMYLMKIYTKEGVSTQKFNIAR